MLPATDINVQCHTWSYSFSHDAAVSQIHCSACYTTLACRVNATRVQRREAGALNLKRAVDEGVWSLVRAAKKKGVHS